MGQAQALTAGTFGKRRMVLRYTRCLLCEETRTTGGIQSGGEIYEIRSFNAWRDRLLCVRYGTLTRHRQLAPLKQTYLCRSLSASAPRALSTAANSISLTPGSSFSAFALLALLSTAALPSRTTLAHDQKHHR